VASAILENDPEPMRTLKPLTPVALERVVSSCLAKNPDERFQNAHDVRLDLEWIAKTSLNLRRSIPRRPTNHASNSALAVAAAVVFAAVGAIFVARRTNLLRNIRV